MSYRRWTLTNRIALFAAVVLLLSLGAIGVTLWASWNLQGGAAAVNEAGRLRMLTYRMTLMAERGDAAAVAQSAAQMQASLDLLRRGDQSRPLFVPWNDEVRQRYDAVLTQWRALQPRWLQAPADEQVPSPVAAHFVATIDAFVTSIEKRLDFWTSLLYTLQFAMAAMMVLGALLLFYAAYLFVLDPVRHLSRGVEAIETGNYSARVDIATNDEFGDLAKAFNGMAAQL
ncbi:MAG: type IV pili methyl-accepting chemotaxis transducer N-terminal domain-containing protein, partial [Thiomonas sp.]|nr:type IV pili methyl-accepting chemotaxis transducer N-terminal domain-containing protein [Thiomonas sp.]